MTLKNQHTARRNKRLQSYLLLNEDRYRITKDKRSINLEDVRGMASIGCTSQEMAAILRCSVHWIDEQQAENPAFALAIEEGRATMKQSLRRAQLTMALNGNAAMLIWLGKQLLGQSDKQQIDNKTEINITVSRAMDELRNIPKDQLLAAQAMLSAPMIEGEAVDLPGDSRAPSAPPPPCVELRGPIVGAPDPET